MKQSDKNNSNGAKENIPAILKNMEVYSLYFDSARVGRGEVYNLRGTDAKVYIRGSRAISIRPERENYQQSKYFLFGNLEDGLYRFGRISDLQKWEDKSFPLTANNGCVSIEDVVTQIKAEFGL